MGNFTSSKNCKTLHSFEKWNELPPELKLECIKHLDFKTRFLLRSTSSTERALVDAQCFNIDHVRIEGLLPYPINSILPSGYDAHKLTINHANYSKSEMHNIPIRNNTRFRETIVPLLVFILKKGKIKEFSVENISRSDWSTVLGELIGPVSINIINFHGVMLKNREILFFVSKLNRATESAHLDANMCQKFPFEALIENQTVRTLKLLQIRDLPCKDAVWKLAEKWIENDSEIGTTFRVTSMENHSIHQFSAKFKDRIISETNEEIRIRTDNPSKHIVLKVSRRLRVSRPLTCTVISSESNELEFETFGSWVTKKVMPLWEYMSILMVDDINEEDDLNFNSFLILLLQCIWLMITMLFQSLFHRS